MNAYEELKAWCEKHLSADDYKVVPESPSYLTTIYLFIDGENIPYICFSEEGNIVNGDCVTNEEMCEHIRDYEENGANDA